VVGRIFDPRQVRRTEAFFDRYGNRALVLARFVPVVRTFVTLVAGVGRMSFRRFIVYTAVGGVVWACGVTVAGFYLGSVPLIRDNVDAVLIVIVVLSLVPMGVEWLLHRRRSAGTSGSSVP
jgi:membrane-associated protein